MSMHEPPSHNQLISIQRPQRLTGRLKLIGDGCEMLRHALRTNCRMLASSFVRDIQQHCPIALMDAS